MWARSARPVPAIALPRIQPRPWLSFWRDAMSKTLLLPLMCVLVMMASCRREKPNYDRPLAPGEVSLQELPVAEWPVFTTAQSNRQDMVEAIDRSLNYLGKPSAANHFPIAESISRALLRAYRNFVAYCFPGPLIAPLTRHFDEISEYSEVLVGTERARCCSPAITRQFLTRVCKRLIPCSVTLYTLGPKT